MSTEEYTGVWTNWSEGRLVGATLTVSTRDGGFLTAFIAVFVTIVGYELWRLSCYILHQLRLAKSHQDQDFHERQVILRNSATPGTGAWLFLVQGFHGRKRKQHSFARALPWVFVSVLFLAVFAVAAIFSSNISKSVSNVRLVKSAVCGFLDAETGDDINIAKSINETIMAAEYARTCYGTISDNSLCSRMPVRKITYSQNQNASCPFGTGLCVYGDAAALQMSTKLIDSHFDLGINAPRQERMQFQLMTTCAPINSTNHVQSYNTTADDQYRPVGEQLWEYQFGPIVSGVGRDKNLTTYVVGNHSVYGNGGYIITSNLHIADTESPSVWTPIQAINRADADVSIFFLEANTVRFDGSNDDPVFGAHQMGSKNDGTFFSDTYATILACAEQTRFCNPNNGKCTPYMGSYQPVGYFEDDSYQELALNTYQIATLTRLAVAVLSSHVSDEVDIRGAGALRITDKAYNRVQTNVPNNQWMIEVNSWFDTTLAKIQLQIQEFATGPSNPAYVPYVERPASNKTLSEQCATQVMGNGSQTTSFSILGLVILFTIGGLIVFLNQFTEPVVGIIQKRTGIGNEKRKCWMADDVMSLYLAASDAKRSSEVDSFLGNNGDHAKYEQVGESNSSYSERLN